MIRIHKAAWEVMLAHARQAYPDECCGALLGSVEGDKQVHVAVPLDNAFEGPRRTRYELRPFDLLCADREARAQGMDVVGIFHSHPDSDAYFSETDLKNSCPWFSFVVLSIKDGEFDHANSWLPNVEQTAAEKEDLRYPG